MRRFASFFVIAIVLTSCAALQKPKTLDQAKAGLNCIEYKEGIEWKKIAEKLGPPDIAPLPEAGTDLSKNARVYKNKIIIFYTERQEVKEGEKVRFREVITKLEVCKEK